MKRMDYKERIAALAGSEEERMTLQQVCERLLRGQMRQSPAFSRFLTQREQALVAQLLPDCRFFGGVREAERCVACYLPEWYDEAELLTQGPICCLRGYFHDKNALTHRDVLGALMGTGIRRDAIGDIYLSETQCDFFVLAELSKYLLDNLTDAGRQRLRLEQIPLAEAVRPPQEMKEVRVSVASLRLDGVLSSAFHLSRSDAAAAVCAGAASIGGLPCLKPDRSVQEGDVLSLRGRGKLRVLSLGGQTRRGRLSLTLGLYV